MYQNSGHHVETNDKQKRNDEASVISTYYNEALVKLHSNPVVISIAAPQMTA